MPYLLLGVVGVLMGWGAGCARTLSYYEQSIDWSTESNETRLYGINLSDGSHIPYPEECLRATPELNHGKLWHGYYFPNTVMRRRFANQYRLSTCLYEELVLGCHPFGIAGYDWPITSCKESVREYMIRYGEAAADPSGTQREGEE